MGLKVQPVEEPVLSTRPRSSRASFATYSRAADVVVERVVSRSGGDKEERLSSRLGDDGTFSMKHLPPGTYDAYLVEELRRQEQQEPTDPTERSTRERRLGQVLIRARETTVFEVEAP